MLSEVEIFSKYSSIKIFQCFQIQKCYSVFLSSLYMYVSHVFITCTLCVWIDTECVNIWIAYTHIHAYVKYIYALDAYILNPPLGFPAVLTHGAHLLFSSACPFLQCSFVLCHFFLTLFTMNRAELSFSVSLLLFLPCAGKVVLLR